MTVEQAYAVLRAVPHSADDSTALSNAIPGQTRREAYLQAQSRLAILDVDIIEVSPSTAKLLACVAQDTQSPVEIYYDWDPNSQQLVAGWNKTALAMNQIKNQWARASGGTGNFGIGTTPNQFFENYADAHSATLAALQKEMQDREARRQEEYLRKMMSLQQEATPLDQQDALMGALAGLFGTQPAKPKPAPEPQKKPEPPPAPPAVTDPKDPKFCLKRPKIT